MPSVACAAQAPVQVALTGCFANPAVPHPPGGCASPCAPAGSVVSHAAPPLQPLARPDVPDVQNARSPCFAESIATVTMPAAANVSATVSMSARPPWNAWWKIIIGAHLPNGASGPAHAGTFALETA